MSMKDHLDFLNKTPQSEPIPLREKEMIRNKAGGYVFKTDEETQLKRFLILGTDGGTYYASEKEHTVENLRGVINYLNKDANAVLSLTAQLSNEGRILKNDTAIVVLAFAWSLGYRDEVEEQFNRIIRIPTHLFMFLKFLKEINGKLKTGRKLRRMISNWYISKERDTLVYHMLKYQNREGWTHRDVLRVMHTKPPNEFIDQLFGFIVGKEKTPDHPLIEAFLKLRKTNTEREVIQVIKEYGITWEFVPSNWLSKASVWEALLPNLPLTALLRNLGRLTAIGVINNFNSAEKFVAERITNKEAVKKARIHPVNVGIAMKTYEQGRGIRGSLSWTPSRAVLEALEEMFFLSFENVDKTGKRFLIGIDASGSMHWGNVSGIPMKSVEAATLVSMPIVRTEPQSIMTGFDHRIWDVPITKNTRWEELRRKIEGGASTDASLPMKYALDRNIEVDVFVIFTDNETWYGDEHPVQALQRYREKTGIPAKLMVGAMTATNYSIVDPKDPYQLDVVGFDPQYPAVLRELALL